MIPIKVCSSVIKLTFLILGAILRIGLLLRFAVYKERPEKKFRVFHGLVINGHYDFIIFIGVQPL